MEDLFKKVFFAGIGTMALTYEKANELVKDLVEKGKITVEQGKQLNEELKRVVKDNNQNTQNMNDIEMNIKTYLDNLNLATKEDIDNINRRIDELEKNI
ncbi:phasin family protein [Schnuerera sp.]|uniref:phasin family protein n=1 Tax=Schnuerera sp. TaxID=2794844 RepID=UPI002C98118B|nr:phasin family protein [Schnuerera sp.]HSH36874.1 phasin family protein [Schnuerera sp.]